MYKSHSQYIGAQRGYFFTNICN